MSRGKKYKVSAEKLNREKLYDLGEASQLLKEISYSKFDGTVNLAVNLGVDPRQADQNVRGATVLPNGLGKSVRIIVFAKGESASIASQLGVEAVGADDLATRISGGWLDFDQVVATPDMMGVVGRLGKVLGPRGLMPNPKLGTVTTDVAKAVNELKAGKAEYRVDKAGIVHAPVGKVSFPSEKIAENIKAVMDALIRLKPQTSKGTYIKKVSLSATMSPGIKIDPSPFRI